MAVVLVVDDEAAVRNVVCRAVEDCGHTAVEAATPEEAVRLGLEHAADLAVLDIDLRHRDINGIGVFAALRSKLPNLIGVALSGRATLKHAFECGVVGIVEIAEKPLRPDQIAQLVKTALGEPLASTTPEAGRRPIPDIAPDFDSMIGRCPAMRKLFEGIRRAARLDQPVLILGETGTGKELVARSVHGRSPRAHGPFVAVNCPAVPATLFESEFFGHERGAFTGAVESREGWFERAHGGTLFLDEIGDLAPDGQAKLLRVIDQREITRVGGGRARPIDARVVAATNVDLKDAVEHGAFRRDLYWRLGAVTLALPPVRHRAGDLERILHATRAKLERELGLTQHEVSSEALALLLRHPWPGNIREIEATLRNALLWSVTGVIKTVDLRLGGSDNETNTGPPGTAKTLPRGMSLTVWLAEETARLEREAIEQALAAAGGNRSAAAATLGIDPRTLYTKIRRHQIA